MQEKSGENACRISGTLPIFSGTLSVGKSGKLFLEPRMNHKGTKKEKTHEAFAGKAGRRELFNRNEFCFFPSYRLHGNILLRHKIKTVTKATVFFQTLNNTQSKE